MWQLDNFKSKLIPNYIYFYHLDKYAILPSYPESITDSMQSTFQETNALARSAPILTYSNSGPRSVTLEIDLHRDLMNDVNVNNVNFKTGVDALNIRDVDYTDILINYLQASALPSYNSYKTSKDIKPPMIAVRLGNDIFIRGVVKGSVTVTREKPILINNKYAKVKISIPITECDPYDAEKVAEVGSFRGLTSMQAAGIFSNSNIDFSTNAVNISDSGSNLQPNFYIGSSPVKKNTAIAV